MVKNQKIFEAVEFKNIKEIIYNSAKKYYENIAFVIKHQKNKKVSYENVTYKRLLEDINKLGTALYNMGLKGKRIAVIGKNRYEWAIAHLTNLLGGMISVPLDKDLQYGELEESLIRSKADCIIYDEKLEDNIQELKKNQKTQISHYICMGEIKEIINKGNELIKQGNNEFINAKIDENAMSILLFTSGTTAQSKAVMLSQKNIASNIYAMQCVEDIRPTDTNIAFLPFHHIFGSTCMVVMLACRSKNSIPRWIKIYKTKFK